MKKHLCALAVAVLLASGAVYATAADGWLEALCAPWEQGSFNWYLFQCYLLPGNGGTNGS